MPDVMLPATISENKIVISMPYAIRWHPDLPSTFVPIFRTGQTVEEYKNKFIEMEEKYGKEISVVFEGNLRLRDRSDNPTFPALAKVFIVGELTTMAGTWPYAAKPTKKIYDGTIEYNYYRWDGKVLRIKLDIPTGKRWIDGVEQPGNFFDAGSGDWYVDLTKLTWEFKKPVPPPMPPPAYAAPVPTAPTAAPTAPPTEARPPTIFEQYPLLLPAILIGAVGIGAYFLLKK
jgi:hypothetical protein